MKLPTSLQFSLCLCIWLSPFAALAQSGLARSFTSVDADDFATAAGGGVNPASIQSNGIPPDTHGAVGDNQVVTVTNGLIGVHQKDGTLLASYGLQNWWTRVAQSDGTGSIRAVFDPMLVFDHYAHRWVFYTSANPQSPGTSVLLALSSTADFIGSSWIVYTIPQYRVAETSIVGSVNGPSPWYDQPSLAITADWIVMSITTGPSSTGNTVTSNSILIASRAAAYQGRAAFTGFRIPMPITCPATCFDAGDRNAYLITPIDPGDAEYRVSRLHQQANGTFRLDVDAATFDFDSAYEFSRTGPQVTDPATNLRGDTPQLSATSRLDATDDRIRSAVVRGGFLYAAHTAFVPRNNPVRSRVQWLKVPALGGSPRTIGSLGTANLWLSFPSIAVNSVGDILMGYSQGNAQQYFSAGYTLIPADGSASSSAVFKSGEAAITFAGRFPAPARARAGDYSVACVDPTDDLSLWTAQEYAKLPGTGGPQSGIWATAWAQVQSAAVGEPALTSATDISGMVGDPLSYTITASGSPTGIRVAGALPWGLNHNSATNVISGTPTLAGDFFVPVEITNALGSITSYLIFTIGPMDLADAIESNPRPVLTSPQPSEPAWFVQGVETCDGVDAAQSADIDDRQSSWMEMEVAGPATISFCWQVDSEEGHDFLRLLVNGARRAAISGDRSWSSHSIDVPAGNHILRWSYDKDATRSVGADAGWVDSLSVRRIFVPILPGNYVAGGAVGELFQFRPEIIRGDSDTRTSFGLSGTLPAGLFFDPTTGVISGTPSTSGTAQLTLTASSAAGTVATPLLLRFLGESLASSVNAPGLPMTTNGTARWFAQEDVSHDGISGGRSGAIRAGESSAMKLTVTGPGVVSFWWRASCHAADAALTLNMDGVEQARLVGEADWRLHRLPLPAGDHDIQWTYSKAGAAVAGLDAGFVDQLAVLAFPPPQTPADSTFLATVGAAVNFTPDFGTGIISRKLIGALPPGLTFDAATGAISGTPESGGDFYFTIEAENAFGATQQVLTMKADGRGLPNAMDQKESHFAQSAPWQVDTGYSADGDSSAKSPFTADGASSWIETSINGPARLSFWWSVSSQDKDHLRVLVDGVARAHISGEQPWQRVDINLEAGAHALRWSYDKDATDSAGSDAGWVDVLGIRPISEPSYYGPAAVGAVLNQPLAWQARFLEADLVTLVGTLPKDLAFNPATRLLTGTPTESGTFPVTLAASNPAGDTLTPLTITIGGASLAEGTDTVGSPLIWTTGGIAPWFVQATESKDGVDAAQSGSFTGGGDSWIKAQVSGPARVSFQWAIRTAKKGGILSAKLDGMEVDIIRDDTNWLPGSIIVPAGEHFIVWHYLSGVDGADGAKSAWLDQVVIEDLSAAPVITSASTASALIETAFNYAIHTDPAASNFAVIGPLPYGLALDPKTGVISGDPLLIGDYAVTLAASNDAGATGTAPLLISVRRPYQVWARQQGLPPLSLPQADDDFDGMPNFLEFALGREAFGADGPAAAPQFWHSGTTIGYEFLRDPAATDLVYQVETSTALGKWQPIAKGSLGQPLHSIGSGATVQEFNQSGLIKVQVTFPTPDPWAQFVRLQVLGE